MNDLKPTKPAQVKLTWEADSKLQVTGKDYEAIQNFINAAVTKGINPTSVGDYIYYNLLSKANDATQRVLTENKESGVVKQQES